MEDETSKRLDSPGEAGGVDPVRAASAGKRAIGLSLLFDPAREYCLEGLDGDGVVEVSAYSGEDGPDGDGFGSETYYDWWYLDGNLRPAPGVECLRGYSNIDRRVSDVQERFEKAREAAAKALNRGAGK